MNEEKVYTDKPNALDIIDEAIHLQSVSANETCSISFAQALEILRIQRFDKMIDKLDYLAGTIEQVAEESELVDSIKHAASETGLERIHSYMGG